MGDSEFCQPEKTLLTEALDKNALSPATRSLFILLYRTNIKKIQCK